MSRQTLLADPLSTSRIYVTMRGFGSPDADLHIYVRYAKGGPNPIRIECHKDDTVYDLIKTLIIRAKEFGLDNAGVTLREGDITVYKVIQDQECNVQKKERLPPRRLLTEVHEFDLEFEADVCEVPVSHARADTSAVFLCRRTETFGDLARKIQTRLPTFHFQEAYLKEIREQLEGGAQLRISEYSSVGGKSKLVDPTTKIGDLEDKTFGFTVETPKKAITLADIKENICGQNIAFFGPSGNGKSSTINTFAKALIGVYQPLAQTFQLEGPGTKVFKPYKFSIENRTFFLCDVPGRGLLVDDDEDSSKIITRILDGKLPAERPLDHKIRFFDRGFGKIHGVVYIHKWEAELDELHTCLSDELATRGSGIPMIVIMTHIDRAQDNPELIAQKCSELAEKIGIDVANVFTISNFDHETEHEDQQRDAHALNLLNKILASAKSFCNRGKVRVSEIVKEFNSLTTTDKH
ncbi:uncharacterized protein [Ptychodera flava]|uniref:uncharacterized protein n=1 Tax=Ptychodera flava TaxID=63121 RepID=UPI00396A0F10